PVQYQNPARDGTRKRERALGPDRDRIRSEREDVTVRGVEPPELRAENVPRGPEVVTQVGPLAQLPVQTLLAQEHSTHRRHYHREQSQRQDELEDGDSSRLHGHMTAPSTTNRRPFA